MYKYDQGSWFELVHLTPTDIAFNVLKGDKYKVLTQNGVWVLADCYEKLYFHVSQIKPCFPPRHKIDPNGQYKVGQYFTVVELNERDIEYGIKFLESFRADQCNDDGTVTAFIPAWIPYTFDLSKVRPTIGPGSVVIPEMYDGCEFFEFVGKECTVQSFVFCGGPRNANIFYIESDLTQRYASWPIQHLLPVATKD